MSDANPATDSLFDEIVSQLADENTPVEAVFREIGRSFASTLEEVDAQLDKALRPPPTVSSTLVAAYPERAALARECVGLLPNLSRVGFRAELHLNATLGTMSAG